MGDDVEPRAKRVYIAHPYNGITGTPEEKCANMVDNAEACRAVMKCFSDVTPVSPLCAFSFCSGADQADIMRCCFNLIDSCKAVWVFGDWTTSYGTVAEIVYALKQCKKVHICHLTSTTIELSDLLISMEDFARLAALKLRQAKAAEYENGFMNHLPCSTTGPAAAISCCTKEDN